MRVCEIITGDLQGQQNMMESVNDYLWHGSRNKHDVLYPRQAVDTGGAEGSNKNAVYATPNAKFAIAMGLTTPGSDTAMFPNDPQMVLFKGDIRKGQMVYLHKVPKDLFIKHNGREWYSKQEVKEVKPIEVIAVPVDKWLHLIRTATAKDLELQKKYMKKQSVKEDASTTEKQILTRIRQIMYDRKLSGTESNAGELHRLKQQLKDMRSKQGVAEGMSGSLSSLVSQDQEERNQYREFVKNKAGGDWDKGAKMYARLKKRSADDIFGDNARLQQFIKMPLNFNGFSDKDWEDYWLLSQHADRYPAFQKQALANIVKHLGKDNDHYRYLSDRISVAATGKQKYGTQNITGQQGVAEGVSDNYLYHACQPGAIMRILKTGVIKGSWRPQVATKARTQHPTISTTRSKQYAESDDFVNWLNLTKEGNSVIIVLDRNAIANHYKMFSTSQGTQTVGDEFEEVIVVPKGSIPINGIMKGFYFNPRRMNEIKEFEDIPWFKDVISSPYYMGKKVMPTKPEPALSMAEGKAAQKINKLSTS